MGGCCTSNKLAENPESNEVEIEPLSNNISNYDIYQNYIEKIQSYFRGMKTRKRLKKQRTTSSYLISNETNLHFTEITSKEFEDFLKLYPPIDLDDNNIQIVKNIILDNKELYYGEYDKEKKSKEGRGILVNKDGTKYYGYFKNNKKNIKGKLKYFEGDIYEGEWLDDRANGKGKYIHADGTTYEGEWVNDKQEGYGLEIWNDGSYYEGYYKNGKKEGKGLYKWADGSSYEGDFKENTINGKGK